MLCVNILSEGEKNECCNQQMERIIQSKTYDT